MSDGKEYDPSLAGEEIIDLNTPSCWILEAITFDHAPPRVASVVTKVYDRKKGSGEQPNASVLAAGDPLSGVKSEIGRGTLLP